ncbi:hypothetical protein LCGC14_2684770 [marine sediment metagenome]|uniref:Uncharacterized protein n=1 Tax=marine sediment metagenome TaxID=412755 RepID=A0A0F9CC02_9ZZZZ
MKENYTPRRPKKANSSCPHCGWQIATTFDFEQLLAKGIPEGIEGEVSAYRSTPVRGPTIEADLLVPAGQALMSAVATMIPTTIIALWARWEWYAPILIGSATVLLQWFRFLNDQSRNTSIIEEFTYVADQGHNRKTSPPNDKLGLRMEVIHKESGIKSRMQLLELPEQIGEVEFAEFLRDIAAGKSLARKNWTGDGKPFTRDTYDGMIDKLLSASVVNRAGNSGTKLTNGGRHAINAMIREGVI